mmetsp:Transcript_34526/g.83404  ORF Transcript_34526/g.83404 Transcript_34526/m.83404 type:complete len:238 (-) Transcript_34526:28-741(-)
MVPWSARSNHAPNALSVMHTDPHRQLRLSELSHSSHSVCPQHILHLQRHPHKVCHIQLASLPLAQPHRAPIGVPNGLNLGYAPLFAKLVELLKKLTNDNEGLLGRECGAHFGEASHVSKQVPHLEFVCAEEAVGAFIRTLLLLHQRHSKNVVRQQVSGKALEEIAKLHCLSYRLEVTALKVLKPEDLAKNNGEAEALSKVSKTDPRIHPLRGSVVTELGSYSHEGCCANDVGAQEKA